MIGDSRTLAAQLESMGLSEWAQVLPEQLNQRIGDRPHGDMPRWQKAIDQLPVLPTQHLKLDQGCVQIGARHESSPEQRAQIEACMRELHPWRKGPYQLHGTFINTEWRSDWKWDRLAPYIASLQGRTVLDVGCGNGYHAWRMLGAGAQAVVGIDPTQLFLAQYQAVSRLLSGVEGAKDWLEKIIFLPLGIEDVPVKLKAFDTVFSMGVLYHRRSPIDHLQELHNALTKDGELVLETLVIEGDDDRVLVPPGRYAKMRNVWFIPTVKQLELWMKRVGFLNVRTVNVSVTCVEEQRSTDWMGFESLVDYLDPADSSLTVEGHPAPRRAIVLANA